MKKRGGKEGKNNVFKNNPPVKKESGLCFDALVGKV